MGQTLLYFVRGRGRGHALAASAIIEQLRKQYSGADVQFVSYGTGAETLRELGHPLIDLELPDQPGIFDVAGKLPALFDALSPTLVAAHEEFDVPTLAQLNGIPCIFLTDWFTAEKDWWMRGLRACQEIIFLDEASAFPAPKYLEGKVTAVGPVLRPLRYLAGQKAMARKDAGLPAEAVVITEFIHPGRRVEEVAPLRALLNEALPLLSDKEVIFISDPQADFDRFMAASDLAITKGNRNIVLELASLGVPTISVSHGLNEIDDLRGASLPNNRLLPYATLDAAQLRQHMQTLLGASFPPRPFADGAVGAAARLAARLRTLAHNPR